MRPRRLLLGAVGLGLALALGVVYFRFVREAEERLDPADLANRAARSSPDWANYEEDIKAQIGAAPIAQWKGNPVAVRRDGALVKVTFLLGEPWAGRDAVVPVLMRDPLGGERRQRSYERRPPEVIYEFALGRENADAVLPWIMLKYPHGEERIALDQDGTWTQEPSAQK